MAQEENDAAAPGAPRKKPTLLFAVLIVCALAGGGVGAFVAAPLFGNAGAPAGEVEEATSKSRHGARSSTPIIYLVENLVLNPSGTAGTRFLMVTAAFELASSGVADEMRGRDSEIRDMLNRNLGGRTIQELTDLDHREAIRDDLRSRIDEMFHAGAVQRVYLPQFVIQ